MNKENMLKLADYIEKVPPEEFDMRYSIHCVIGHCRKSDLFEDYSTFDNLLDISNEILIYIAANSWYKIDNTPIGAAKRIRYLVNNPLPDNWIEQIIGRDELSYL